MSEESKTYVFGNEGNMSSVLAALLSQRGVDPSILALMNNNDGLGGGGAFIWAFFLMILLGMGGNGFGGNNNAFLSSQLNNDYGREALMQAINGNGQAINSLASTLNCDHNMVQLAINSLSQSVLAVGNNVGMSRDQVINAVQAGNCDIAQQLSKCCCDNRLLATQNSYENRLALTQQTAAITGKIDAQSVLISDKFCDLEKREMQSKIDSLLEKNNTLQSAIDNAQLTAAILGYIHNTVSPIASDVAAIKAQLPSTTTVPYSPVTAIPTCQAYALGYNNWYGNGCYNNGSIWG